jgi:uroporphyrinogen-III synthase
VNLAGSLKGIRVLITRPRERAGELCRELQREGARVFAIPVLELLPPDDQGPLKAAAKNLSSFQWVMFASPSAVHALCDAARELGTESQLNKLRIGAVGPKTAQAARECGLSGVTEAAQSTGTGLFQALQGGLKPGDAVLLPAAQEGRRELQDALERNGARVTWVAAYRTEAGRVDPKVLSQLAADPPELVLFASPRTVRAFLDLHPTQSRTILSAASVIAIGPTTAAALETLQIPVHAVAARPTSEAIVDACARAIRG